MEDVPYIWNLFIRNVTNKQLQIKRVKIWNPIASPFFRYLTVFGVVIISIISAHAPYLCIVL